MATKRPGDDSNGNGHAAGNGEAPEAKKTKDVSNWTFKSGAIRHIFLDLMALMHISIVLYLF